MSDQTTLIAHDDAESMLELAGRHFTDMPTAHLGRIESLRHEGFDGFRVTMYEAPPLKSGPRKGRPNWRKATAKKTHYITNAEFDQFKADWSERTGRCSTCTGTGEVFARWHHIEGTTYKPCAACSATGRAA